MSGQICKCYPMKLSEACQHESIEAAKWVLADKQDRLQYHLVAAIADINSPLIAIHSPIKE